MTPKVTFSTNPNTTSAENKRMFAMYKSAAITQGITESVEAYHKRMAQWQEELSAKIKEENTSILQNKLNGIDTKVTTNLYSLNTANNNIASLKFWRFTLGKYDTSLEQQLTAVIDKQTSIQNQIAIIKKSGEKKDKLDIRDGLGLRSASEEEALLNNLAAPKTGMFDNDQLKTGSRNILT